MAMGTSNGLRPACNWGLYAITDTYLSGRSHLEVAREAIAGGVKVVQLRDKELPFEALVQIGRQIAILAHSQGATFIVNDNPHLTIESGADGVHLGQDDMPAAAARDILGSDRIIGLSTHNREQVLAAQLQPVDYIGVGPVYSTTSKDSKWSPVGTELIAWAAQSSRLPVVAIGGITEDNLPDVLAAGARNVAIIGAIVRQPSISATVGRINAMISAAHSGAAEAQR